jgi:hypothetical protein
MPPPRPSDSANSSILATLETVGGLDFGEELGRLSFRVLCSLTETGWRAAADDDVGTDRRPSLLRLPFPRGGDRCDFFGLTMSKSAAAESDLLRDGDSDGLLMSSTEIAGEKLGLL